MNILILTQYFPPETGAPQNRLHSLATHLQSMGAKVSVLTAMPNYPQAIVYPAYKGKWFVRENMDGLLIYRSWIYASGSKRILPRLLNYFSFVFTSLFVGLFSISRKDVIICESPPLFLGITALLIKWIKSSKLVFNVSDLWPESAEKLGIVENKVVLKPAYLLEKILYKNANLVSGQTQGIIDNIQSRYPKTPLFLLRNGIDTEQFSAPGNRKDWREQHGLRDMDFVAVYAGIIGHAQGLEIIVEAANQLKSNSQIQFVLVGDGPEKEKLVGLAAFYQLANIQFVPSVQRSAMPDIIAGCDCYITPLRKNDLFKGAIPSKIFEPLYYAKPVIMGVDGEAKHLFVDEGNCAMHFEPENTNQLVACIQKLSSDAPLATQLGQNGRQYVASKFDRKQLAALFWNRIQTL